MKQAKQINLFLAEQLENRTDDDGRVFVRADSAYIQCKAENARKIAEALRKITPSRKRLSTARDHRVYPVFEAGMSTAKYVALFQGANASIRDSRVSKERGVFCTLQFGTLNKAPCGLYEGGAVDYEVAHEVEVEELPEPATITRADVEAAQQQAAASIGARIDAMSAGGVNKIAKQFLPTMGVKLAISKAGNKAAMVDAKINLMAAAAEVGAVLPAEVVRALQADMEGRVFEGEQPTQAQIEPADLPQVQSEGPTTEAQDMQPAAHAEPLPNVLALTVADVQAMPEAEYSAACDALEDVNHHSECLMLECLRAGRDDLAQAIAHLVRRQQSPEYTGISMDEVHARGIIYAMARGSDVPHDMEDGVRAVLESWGLAVHKHASFESVASAANDAEFHDSACDVTPPVVQKAEHVTPSVAAPSALTVEQLTAAGVHTAVAQSIVAHGLDAYGPEAQGEIRAKLAAAAVRDPGPMAQLMAQAREARRIMREAIAKARASSFTAARADKLARLVGVGVRYRGDMANPDGVGAIMEATENYARIILEDGRRIEYAWQELAIAMKATGSHRIESTKMMHGTPYMAQLQAAYELAQTNAKAEKDVEHCESIATHAEIVGKVRFMTHYVTDGKHKIRARYSINTDIAGNELVWIDAKEYGVELRKIFPNVRNDSDTMTDYFCKDSVKITSDSPLYPAALARAQANDAARRARYDKRMEKRGHTA